MQFHFQFHKAKSHCTAIGARAPHITGGARQVFGARQNHTSTTGFIDRKKSNIYMRKQFFSSNWNASTSISDVPKITQLYAITQISALSDTQAWFSKILQISISRPLPLLLKLDLQTLSPIVQSVIHSFVWTPWHLKKRRIWSSPVSIEITYVITPTIHLTIRTTFTNVSTSTVNEGVKN